MAPSVAGWRIVRSGEAIASAVGVGGSPHRAIASGRAGRGLVRPGRRVVVSPATAPVPDAIPPIRIAAALVLGRDGRMSLARERGTRASMQPGGEIEAHETPVAALVREARERSDLVVPPSRPVRLGRFAAPAANEPGHVVEAEPFGPAPPGLAAPGAVAPAAEIEDVVRVDPAAAAGLVLAPLTRGYVPPLHRASRDRRGA